MNTRSQLSSTRHTIGRALLVLFLSLSWLAVPPAHAQTTIAADRFVDSVGVNIHLHNDGTLYRDNFPLIQSRLLELGVRHVRDGLIDTEWQEYYDRLNALGQAGIKGLFIVSPGMSDALLHSYPSRVPASFEAYEAPNEYNWSGDPAWASTLRTTLVQLRGLRNHPALAGYPIFGPSLTEESAYAALGDITALVDTGNLHNYFAGRHPGTEGWGAAGYGSIDWNLRNVTSIARGKPVVTTETGYWDDAALVDAIPPAVIAKYVPRMVLEQFRKGIARTYVYELVDFPEARRESWSGYGLLTRDGTRKPAFVALQGLLALLSDPGPAFEVRPIPYAVPDAGADVRHMMFQKRDGRNYLAIWIEQSGYDIAARATIAVAPRTVTLTLPDSVRPVNTHAWQADGRMTSTALTGSRSIPISITDRLTVVELRAPAAAPAAVAAVRVAVSY